MTALQSSFRSPLSPSSRQPSQPSPITTQQQQTPKNRINTSTHHASIIPTTNDTPSSAHISRKLLGTAGSSSRQRSGLGEGRRSPGVVLLKGRIGMVGGIGVGGSVGMVRVATGIQPSRLGEEETPLSGDPNANFGSSHEQSRPNSLPPPSQPPLHSHSQSVHTDTNKSFNPSPPAPNPDRIHLSNPAPSTLPSQPPLSRLHQPPLSFNILHLDSPDTSFEDHITPTPSPAHKRGKRDENITLEEAERRSRSLSVGLGMEWGMMEEMEAGADTDTGDKGKKGRKSVVKGKVQDKENGMMKMMGPGRRKKISDDPLSLSPESLNPDISMRRIINSRRHNMEQTQSDSAIASQSPYLASEHTLNANKKTKQNKHLESDSPLASIESALKVILAHSPTKATTMTGGLKSILKATPRGKGSQRISTDVSGFGSKGVGSRLGGVGNGSGIEEDMGFEVWQDVIDVIQNEESRLDTLDDADEQLMDGPIIGTTLSSMSLVSSSRFSSSQTAALTTAGTTTITQLGSAARPRPRMRKAFVEMAGTRQRKSLVEVEVPSLRVADNACRTGVVVSGRRSFADIGMDESEDEDRDGEIGGARGEEIGLNAVEMDVADEGGTDMESVGVSSQQSILSASQLVPAQSSSQLSQPITTTTTHKQVLTTPSRPQTRSKRRIRALDSPSARSPIKRASATTGERGPTGGGGVEADHTGESPNPRARKSRKSVAVTLGADASVAGDGSGLSTAETDGKSKRKAPAGRKSLGATKPVSALSAGTTQTDTTLERITKPSSRRRVRTPDGQITKKRVIPATERPIRRKTLRLTPPGGATRRGGSRSSTASNSPGDNTSTGRSAVPTRKSPSGAALRRRHSAGAVLHSFPNVMLPAPEPPGSPGDDPLLLVGTKASIDSDEWELDEERLVAPKSAKRREAFMDRLRSVGSETSERDRATRSRSPEMPLGQENEGEMDDNDLMDETTPFDYGAPPSTPSDRAASRTGSPVSRTSIRSVGSNSMSVDTPTKPSGSARSGSNQLTPTATDRSKRGLRGGSGGPPIRLAFVPSPENGNWQTLSPGLFEGMAFPSPAPSAPATASPANTLSRRRSNSPLSPITTGTYQTAPQTTQPSLPILKPATMPDGPSPVRRQTETPSTRKSPPAVASSTGSNSSPEKDRGQMAAEDVYMDDQDWQAEERDSDSPEPHDWSPQDGLGEEPAVPQPGEVQAETGTETRDGGDLEAEEMFQRYTQDDTAEEEEQIEEKEEALDDDRQGSGEVKYPPMYPKHVLVKVVKMEPREHADAVDDEQGSPVPAEESVEAEDRGVPPEASQEAKSNSESSVSPGRDSPQKERSLSPTPAESFSLGEEIKRANQSRHGSRSASVAFSATDVAPRTPRRAIHRFNLDDAGNTSVVEIASLDPRAAARAAAILKLHDGYIVSGQLPDVEVSAIEARRKSIKRRRSTHFATIEAASALTPAEQLVEAELELVDLEGEGSQSDQRSRSISRAASHRQADADRLTIKRKDVAAPTTLEWTAREWRDLERCIKRARRSAAIKGKGPARTSPDEAERLGQSVSHDVIIAQFMSMRGLTEGQIYGTDWSRDMIEIRIAAILTRRSQKSQAASPKKLVDEHRPEESPAKPPKRPRIETDGAALARAGLSSEPPSTTSATSFLTKIYTGLQGILTPKMKDTASLPSIDQIDADVDINMPKRTHQDDGLPSAAIDVPGGYPTSATRRGVRSDWNKHSAAPMQDDEQIRQTGPSRILPISYRSTGSTAPGSVVHRRSAGGVTHANSQHQAAIEALFKDKDKSGESFSASSLATSIRPSATIISAEALAAAAAKAGPGILRPSRLSTESTSAMDIPVIKANRPSLYIPLTPSGSPSVRDMARSYETSFLSAGDTSMESMGGGLGRKGSRLSLGKGTVAGAGAVDE